MESRYTVALDGVVIGELVESEDTDKKLGGCRAIPLDPGRAILKVQRGDWHGRLVTGRHAAHEQAIEYLRNGKPGAVELTVPAKFTPNQLRVVREIAGHGGRMGYSDLMASFRQEGSKRKAVVGATFQAKDGKKAVLKVKVDMVTRAVNALCSSGALTFDMDGYALTEIGRQAVGLSQPKLAL